MEPEARYTLIGAVLLALIAGALGAFVWLSSSGRTSDFNFFTVYFERQSLDGLQIGGDVNMRGVKVGRVENYSISSDNINRVDVVLRVSRNMPVSENTTAVVARNLVTGIARINLETPGKPGPELTAVPPGERFPVIPEGTSDLDQIATSLNRLAQKSNTGLDNLNRVLDPANQKALSETLIAVRDLTQGLRDRLPLLDSSARSVNSAAAEFQKTSQALGTATRDVNAVIQPIGQETTAALRDARAALQTFTETGRALEQRVNTSLSSLDTQIGALTNKSTGALDVGVLELRATAEEVRSSVELISRALDRLQDPKAALFGPSNAQYGPGEEPRR